MILKIIITLALLLSGTQIKGNHNSVRMNISQVVCPGPLCES